MMNNYTRKPKYTLDEIFYSFLRLFPNQGADIEDAISRGKYEANTLGLTGEEAWHHIYAVVDEIIDH